MKAKRNERPSPRWAFVERGSRQSTGLPLAGRLSAPERAEAKKLSSIVPSAEAFNKSA